MVALLSYYVYLQQVRFFWPHFCIRVRIKFRKMVTTYLEFKIIYYVFASCSNN